MDGWRPLLIGSSGILTTKVSIFYLRKLHEVLCKIFRLNHLLSIRNSDQFKFTFYSGTPS
jgi:hypothetical protein